MIVRWENRTDVKKGDTKIEVFSVGECFKEWYGKKIYIYVYVTMDWIDTEFYKKKKKKFSASARNLINFETR